VAKSGESGPCKLCGEEKPLQDSHVLSELVYAPVYKGEGTDHWTVGLWRDQGGVLKKRKVQLGLREPLLCWDCEQLLNNRYERPSTALWRHLASGEPLPAGITTQVRQGASEDRGIRFGGVDYTSWKLFLLSLLWRASVAEKQEWSGVDLGPKHEAALRRMLLEQDPGGQGDYPCVVYLVEEKSRLIAFPGPSRLEGHNCYVFHLTQVVLLFLVSSHLGAEEQRWGIDPLGTFLGVQLSRLDDVPGMQGTRKLVEEAGELPEKMR
jgi:hypothetical protein